MKKTLLKDLAEKLGISIALVSRALNHPECVSADTRKNVLQLARKMKYRNLSWRHRKKIAVLIDFFADFNDHLLNRIINEAGRMKYSFSIITMENLDLLNDQFFDGAILISHNLDRIKWREKFKMPLVVINHYGNPLEKIASVFPDADHEVMTAMMHFISLGHKKIARIHPITSKSIKKSRGSDEFYRIAEENGIRDQVCSLCVEDSAEAILEKILTLADEGFTAFLVITSDKAPRLLHDIRQSGLRVPEDISLITYEYNNSAYTNPPLTTIEYNYEQLVRKAIEQLKNEIAGRQIIPEIQIPCRLNIRGSTAVPAAGKKLQIQGRIRKKTASV